MLARRRIEGLILAVSIYGLATQLQAQTAQISGAVQDNSGAAVVKAAVRVISQVTLVERHATTNSAGLYAVPYLTPGDYQVIIEAPGFQTAVSNITLNVDQILVLNIQLKIGAESIKVEVQAPAEAIDLNDGQLSGVVDAREINALPLILREP